MPPTPASQPPEASPGHPGPQPQRSLRPVQPATAQPGSSPSQPCPCRPTAALSGAPGQRSSPLGSRQAARHAAGLALLPGQGGGLFLRPPHEGPAAGQSGHADTPAGTHAAPQPHRDQTGTRAPAARTTRTLLPRTRPVPVPVPSADPRVCVHGRCHVHASAPVCTRAVCVRCVWRGVFPVLGWTPGRGRGHRSRTRAKSRPVVARWLSCLLMLGTEPGGALPRSCTPSPFPCFQTGSLTCLGGLELGSRLWEQGRARLRSGFPDGAHPGPG